MLGEVYTVLFIRAALRFGKVRLHALNSITDSKGTIVIQGCWL